MTATGDMELPGYWNGKWFEPTSLKTLGLVLELGHEHEPGMACVLPQEAHHDFTVIHTNGIHPVSVRFCGCNALLDNRKQLLRNMWFPATPINPQTVTTFSCLRQFQHFNCLGKLPAYDYYRGLQIMTESAQRTKVPDRYPVFLRSVVQWRHLKMCKRGGRGHAATGINGTALGELVVECPACPHPGKNLPTDWDRASPEEAFLYTMFFAIDANFRLRNRVVSNEYRSPILGDGWAYLVPSIPYREHLENYVSEREMGSCSGFAAMFLANLRNVTGLRSSGVGGVCCGRHRFWRKNGLGDLQKGERYCNIDFIFWCTIQGEEYLVIVISYDISCQWSINFWKRMADLDPKFNVKFTPNGVRFMVPKFHLRAHQTKCHTRFSFDYAPGCGATHGEVIEEGWAQSNKAAAQTKEMGPGSRAMTLDDIFGFHNWLNLEKLDQVLAKRLVNAVKEFEIHYQDFIQFDSGLEKTLGRPLLDEWKEKVMRWEQDHDEECPYEDESDNDKAQFKLRQLELLEDEQSALKEGVSGYASSPSGFIVQGIELQEAQRGVALFLVVNKTLTRTQQLDLAKRRSNLMKRLSEFRRSQDLLMPRLSQVISDDEMKHITDPDHSCPEKVPLYLPSDIPQLADRIHACVAKLPRIEANLREAEAQDALEGVRDGLRARTGATRFKIRNITGQVGSTRAAGVLRQIDIRIHSRKIRYRIAREALLRLRGCGKWEEALKPLLDEDVRGINERALTKEEQREREERIKRVGVEPDSDGEEFLIEEGIVSRVRGEGKRRLSWIWYRPDVSEDDPEFRDAICVEWCKSRARLQRWREEVLLLTEELGRMTDYALWKAEWWFQRFVGKEGMKGADIDPDLAEGLNSYAWQQANFQSQAAEQTLDKWGELTKHARSVLARNANLKTITVDVEDGEEEKLGVEREAEEDI
ncbi:hypothetical protein K435DRAFT_799447 [Dendrothele bispora CBS 962.96]|uniref:CxC2-like cysteine cluster KDZ transposase-associated domain-containing protein n=1 Tax=Dendrothele bispora (strain CBS 962.96) TaxID=1314807 RepID=A0A4S8LWB5_DENBC|nr:hypothetical protein K435DRAFT_799447 [Dendrothele bispora CBS 962.96]